jgi:hypothetical protein
MCLSPTQNLAVGFTSLFGAVREISTVKIWRCCDLHAAVRAVAYFLTTQRASLSPSVTVRTKRSPIRPGCGFYVFESNYLSLGWGEEASGLVIKFASLENALVAATLVMFTVFVLWSVKIIVAST